MGLLGAAIVTGAMMKWAAETERRQGVGYWHALAQATGARVKPLPGRGDLVLEHSRGSTVVTVTTAELARESPSTWVPADLRMSCAADNHPPAFEIRPAAFVDDGPHVLAPQLTVDCRDDQSLLVQGLVGPVVERLLNVRFLHSLSSDGKHLSLDLARTRIPKTEYIETLDLVFSLALASTPIRIGPVITPDGSLVTAATIETPRDRRLSVWIGESGNITGEGASALPSDAAQAAQGVGEASLSCHQGQAKLIWSRIETRPRRLRAGVRLLMAMHTHHSAYR
jgi:hypothetical protein